MEDIYPKSSCNGSFLSCLFLICRRRLKCEKRLRQQTDGHGSKVLLEAHLAHGQVQTNKVRLSNYNSSLNFYTKNSNICINVKSGTAYTCTCF